MFKRILAMYYLTLYILYEEYKCQQTLCRQCSAGCTWLAQYAACCRLISGWRVQRFIGRAVPSRSKVYTAETGTESERLVGMTCEKEVGS